MNFNSLVQKVTAGVDQVKQIATERLVQVDPDCVTELPQDYLEMEKKLLKLKTLHETFLRLSRSFSHSDYDPSLQESFKDAFGKLNGMVSKRSFDNHQDSAPFSPNGSADSSQAKELPKTLAHAFSKASFEAAESLGNTTSDPIASALTKFGESNRKIGDARLELESQVVNKFTHPWTATLNNSIQFAMKARKELNNCRVNFDQAKMKLKHAKEGKLANAQDDLTKSETEYQDALRDAMYKMRLVVDSPEPLRNLSDLVSAQLEFHKFAFEALNELAPEMDEMQVTQEALFRNSQ